MTTHPEPWPPGTPAWPDLMVTDLAAAQQFYAALFGWEFEAAPAPDGTTYLLASVDGRNAAGLGDVVPGPDDPSPEWTLYLATDDLDVTVDTAVHAGATVLVPPIDAGDAGALAVLVDPAGAVFGLWLSAALTGVDVVDEPGAMTWAETMSEDDDVARDFYATTFGYTYTDLSGPDFSYRTFAVGGRTAGGIGRLPDEVGDDVDPHWLIYFAVTDVDDAVDVARRHGGGVLREPWDSAFGRIAVLTGPAGETFAVHTSLAADAAGGQAPAAGA
ncbi:VOC family protein [Cellulomonas sp. ATA003]|uniref:VOC family protein n=1 Tax=Cellulomonas sp. ATA003 TaxID=3073064 RepID=UPI0028738350|nr:VOC family protein [Cellulomonas sp. ATA003]WNB85345.1 VOC family protein [Cellulomonas sp. ATA003]